MKHAHDTIFGLLSALGASWRDYIAIAGIESRESLLSYMIETQVKSMEEFDEFVRLAKSYLSNEDGELAMSVLEHVGSKKLGCW